MKRPDAVLFDMGGVLKDSVDTVTEDFFAKCFPGALPEPLAKPQFLDLSRTVFEHFLSRPVPRPAVDSRPVIAQWLTDAGLAADAPCVEICHDLVAQWELAPIYGFARPALKELVAMGFRLGLVSNTMIPGDHNARQFAETGIADCFEVLVFSANFGMNKPEPSIFRHALAAMRVEPADAWYVGDKPQRDICGAHAVGMTAVLVDSPHTDHIHDAPENFPDLRIRDISELPALLAHCDV